MNEITKVLKCILVRGGIEIWVEEERIEKVLESVKGKKMMRIDDNIINTADIVGIFDADTMADKTRRSNGQWKDENGSWRNRGEWLCDYGIWHTKGDFCKCTNSLGYRNPPSK